MVSRQIHQREMVAIQEFLDFLLDPLTHRESSLGTQRLPSSRALLSLDFNQNPQFRDVVLPLQNTLPMPVSPEMLHIWDAIRSNLQYLRSGLKSPEKAAFDMQKEAENALGF